MTIITVPRELLEQALSALDAGHQFGSNQELVDALRVALAAPPQVPLTEEEIDDIWDCTFSQDDPSRTRSFRQIITRAIERAQGIGEKT